MSNPLRESTVESYTRFQSTVYYAPFTRTHSLRKRLDRRKVVIQMLIGIRFFAEFKMTQQV
jgi:hypothetical protein